MGVLSKLWLTLTLLLILGSCSNMFLTSPYFFGGEIELFLDGQAVACANLDRSFDEDLSGYGFYLYSGYNPVDALEEMIIYQRGLHASEIVFLKKNIGSQPADADRLAGYYKFDGNGDCENTIDPDGTIDSTLNGMQTVSGMAPSYPTIATGRQVLSPAVGSMLQLGDYVLPARFEDFTVNFWFKEDLDNSEEANLFRIADRNDSGKAEIDLTIEPGGYFVLTIGTNLQKIWFKPDEDYDDQDGHMITLRFWNR